MVDDYLGLMGGAQNVGGAPAAIQNALLGQQQIQGNAFQLQQAQQQQADQMAYRQAVSQTLANPSPQAFSRLGQQFPQYTKETKDAMAVYGQPQKDAMFRTAVNIHHLITSGAWDTALADAQKERDAEVAAGMDASHWDGIIEAIKAKSPYALGGAAAVIEAYDPTKYAEVHKALNPSESMGPDQKQYDFDVRTYGKAYADQAKLIRDTKLVSSPNGVYTLAPNAPSNAGGGDPSSTGTPPAPELGPNGNPATLTPEQYKGAVNALGKEKTDAWMARNGITLSGGGETTRVIGGKTYHLIDGQWYEGDR